MRCCFIRVVKHNAMLCFIRVVKLNDPHLNFYSATIKCNNMYLLSCFIAVNGRVASNLQSIFCFKGEYDDDDDDTVDGADGGGDDDADSGGDDDGADNDNEIDDDDMSKQSNMV